MIPEPRVQELMMLAIEQAKLSRPEDDTPRPKVGGVLADADGNVLAMAHRGAA
jgi:hypothetical protein